MTEKIIDFDYIKAKIQYLEHMNYPEKRVFVTNLQLSFVANADKEVFLLVDYDGEKLKELAKVLLQVIPEDNSHE